jgi:hypothetical protein
MARRINSDDLPASGSNLRESQVAEDEGRENAAHGPIRPLPPWRRRAQEDEGESSEHDEYVLDAADEDRDSSDLDHDDLESQVAEDEGRADEESQVAEDEGRENAAHGPICPLPPWRRRAHPYTGRFVPTLLPKPMPRHSPRPLSPPLPIGQALNPTPRRVKAATPRRLPRPLSPPLPIEQALDPTPRRVKARTPQGRLQAAKPQGSLHLVAKPIGPPIPPRCLTQSAPSAIGQALTPIGQASIPIGQAVVPQAKTPAGLVEPDPNDKRGSDSDPWNLS